jgi:hypothetical protein
MNIHSIADGARKKIPGFIFNPLRKFVNAFLGPVCFSLSTGHIRSAFKSFAVDRHGNPLPWFSYPAIQLLLSSDFTSKCVLEWGAGQSTLFWAKRAREVVSFEHDRAWADLLRPKLPANVKLHVIKEDMSDYNSKLSPGKFDVIIVDGLDRYKSAQLSLDLVAEGGVIIVDNSEGNHGEINSPSAASFPAQGDPKASYGIVNLYTDCGFSRADFYGFAPGVSVQQCTSVFFKGDCFLFHREDIPTIKIADKK